MPIWKTDASLSSINRQLTRAHLIAVVWEGIELPLELNQAKHTHTHTLTILLNERRYQLSFLPLFHLHFAHSLLLPTLHPPSSSVKAFRLNSSCLLPPLSVTFCPVMCFLQSCWQTSLSLPFSFVSNVASKPLPLSSSRSFFREAPPILYK